MMNITFFRFLMMKWCTKKESSLKDARKRMGKVCKSPPPFKLYDLSSWKKLLFMGGEFGQWLEWNCKEEIHWDVLGMPYHQQLQECVIQLNVFYKNILLYTKMIFRKKDLNGLTIQIRQIVFSLT